LFAPEAISGFLGASAAKQAIGEESPLVPLKHDLLSRKSPGKERGQARVQDPVVPGFGDAMALVFEGQ
jgi:hypothetical protein